MCHVVKINLGRENFDDEVCPVQELNVMIGLVSLCLLKCVFFPPR